jgi:hypothetical protein
MFSFHSQLSTTFDAQNRGRRDGDRGWGDFEITAFNWFFFPLNLAFLILFRLFIHKFYLDFELFL